MRKMLNASSGRRSRGGSRAAAELPLADGDPVQAVHADRDDDSRVDFREQECRKRPAALCKAEADPARPRWNNTGMPQIQQSLAALYDWQQAQGKKPNNP